MRLIGNGAKISFHGHKVRLQGRRAYLNRMPIWQGIYSVLALQR